MVRVWCATPSDKNWFPIRSMGEWSRTRKVGRKTGRMVGRGKRGRRGRRNGSYLSDGRLVDSATLWCVLGRYCSLRHSGLSLYGSLILCRSLVAGGRLVAASNSGALGIWIVL